MRRFRVPFTPNVLTTDWTNRCRQYYDNTESLQKEMLSSSSYGLIQLILSNRVTENANKILGRKILPGSFSVLSHVSLAHFAWRMPGGIVHWPFGSGWATAATTKSSVASDFFYRSFAPEEISEMFVNSSKWHQLWHWQLWSYEAEVSQLGSPLDSKAETNKIWRGIWASLDACSRHSKFWTSIDKEW
jgi:hypothetical protein